MEMKYVMNEFFVSCWLYLVPVVLYLLKLFFEKSSSQQKKKKKKKKKKTHTN